MKKIMICVILVFGVINFTFGNEKNTEMIDSNTNSSNDPYYYIKKFDLSVNDIFIGTSFLGMTSILYTTILSFIPFQVTKVFDIYFSTLGDLFLYGASGVFLVPGVILSCIGIYSFHKKVTDFDKEKLSLYFMNKSKNFLKIAIPNIPISAVSTVVSAAGIVLSVFGLKIYHLDEMEIAGIILDVLGGIGLVVSLPMMISSLAMSAWWKCKLSIISPEISLTHDDKKDFTDGYGIKMGLKVRI